MEKVCNFLRKRLPLMVVVAIICSAGWTTSVRAAGNGENAIDEVINTGSGVLVFSHAKCMERVEGSKQGYSQRDVTAADFTGVYYFEGIPTRIQFMGEQKAEISGVDWTKQAFPLFYESGGMLEFRSEEMLSREDFPDLDERPEIYRRMVLAPSYVNAKIEGGVLSMQHTYHYYVREKEQYMEGILTLYYK